MERWKQFNKIDDIRYAVQKFNRQLNNRFKSFIFECCRLIYLIRSDFVTETLML